MKCRLCLWLCTWFCPDVSPAWDVFWEQADRWDRGHSNEYALFSKISGEARERLDAATAIWPTNPDAAFRIYLDLADGGVAWAMETVACQYAQGTHVAQDFEQAAVYYRRAIEAGSWIATVRYAQLMAKLGHFDICQKTLEDGVQAGFIPAFYWLAWFRYRQSKNRRTCREIKPLLERATAAGHPAAALLLAQMRLGGKFGLRETPQGFREMAQIGGQVVSLTDSRQIPAAAA